MGTLIELFLAVIWNNFIVGSGWRVSVNYVTEYPNLFLRDEDGGIYLRIETKALHDEADEGAARFDTVTPLIDSSLDALAVLGWRWGRKHVRRSELVFPLIVAADTFSAIEVARERDTRFRIVGGSFRAGGRPYVRSKKGGNWVPDPGNYGKLNRIVHRSRAHNDLSEEIKAYVALLNQLYPERHTVMATGPTSTR